MMDTIIAIGITTQITALFLWLGMRFTGVNGTYLGMQIVSFAHFILALIPFIGPILATIVAYILLDKFTDADFWGIIFMVVAAWALKFLAAVLIITALISTV